MRKTGMIGPFTTGKEANAACDAANAARSDPDPSEPLPRGRWFVFPAHGFWLRWAPPGPFDEPTRNCTIVPELWDFFMAQRAERV